MRPNSYQTPSNCEDEDFAQGSAIHRVRIAESTNVAAVVFFLISAFSPVVRDASLLLFFRFPDAWLLPSPYEVGWLIYLTLCLVFTVVVCAVWAAFAVTLLTLLRRVLTQTQLRWLLILLAFVLSRIAANAFQGAT